MDNDKKFVPQSDGFHVKEGHDTEEVSVSIIIKSAAVLIICGVVAFVGSVFFLRGLEKFERRYFDVQLTPMEHKMHDQRAVPIAPERGAAAGEETKPLPDTSGRAELEEHLRRTIPVPRLQYDDTHDMDIFKTSEDEWLNTAGKAQDGGVRIPIAQAMDLLAQRGLPPVSGEFSTAGPQMPAPLSTVWQELVPGSTGQPRPANKAARGGTKR
jgi:hypothetical protein